MTNLPKTTTEMLDWWPGNIPFKGRLVSFDGTCMCAQGQTLHLLGGYSVDDLREMNQLKADAENARIWGISRAHSVLMRRINDSRPGAPSIVITHPELVLGDRAQTVLAFWRHLDTMTDAARDAARDAAWNAAGDAAWNAAWNAAGDAAWNAARDAAANAAGDAAWNAAANAAWNAAWNAAGDAAWATNEIQGAAWATNEIQGAAIMRKKGQPFYFLPLFGFADPDAVLAT